MVKKAQSTFYIVLIVIMALMVSVYIALNSIDADQTDSDQSLHESEDLTQVRSFVENCMKEVALTGMMKMGLQGGYINLPENYFSTIYSDVPFYYFEGYDKSPSLYQLEIELASYVNDNVDNCIYNFNAFRQEGYIIEAGSKKTSATFGDREVFIEMNYPVTILKDLNRYSLSVFNYKAPVRMKVMHEISQSVMKRVLMDPYMIHQSHLLSLMDLFDVQMDTLASEDGVVTYVIRDDHSLLWPDTNLMFLFATKYDTTEKAPIIFMEKDVYDVDAGKKLFISVDAYDPDGDELNYDVDSPYASVNRFTGIMSFSADEPGIYTLIAYVSDGDSTVSKEITVRVRE